MAAEKLRDLSQPIDVALLDATVAAFYGTGSKEEVSNAFPLPFSRSFFNLSTIHLCLYMCNFYSKISSKCGAIRTFEWV